jgi:DNA-binding response OmpR family regulator
VHGLKAGGRRLLTKPFAFAELLGALEALSRRGAASNEQRLKIADLELYLAGGGAKPSPARTIRADDSRSSSLARIPVAPPGQT